MHSPERRGEEQIDGATEKTWNVKRKVEDSLQSPQGRPGTVIQHGFSSEMEFYGVRV